MELAGLFRKGCAGWQLDDVRMAGDICGYISK